VRNSQAVFLPGDRDWKHVLSGSFRDLGELLDFCEIDVSQTVFKARHDFPLRVTRYFASLIEKGNVIDPLLLQVLPDAREFRYIDGYTEDAVGDQQAMPVPGLIHKYHGRVLLTLTGACAIHCRYCFRRHFPYADAAVDYDMDGQVMSYLAGNPEVSEVILSGGDPLMVSDRKLANLVSGLNSIPHVRILRIHSRLLSVLPERVNEAFIETLRQFRGQTVFVTHINHPNEISTHNQATFSRLAGQGYKIFNQSVLLKRVNDSAQTLAELSNKLFASDIIPYYLHRLDRVQGAAHFDLSVRESCRIYHQLRDRLPGYLLPAFVEEVAGQSSKTPVRCN